MPFDASPAETPADPFTLESLVRWLERQPADERYCFLKNGGCAFFHYAQSCGLPVKRVGGRYWRDLKNETHDFPANIPLLAALTPHTYGAMLDRARALLAQERGNG